MLSLLLSKFGGYIAAAVAAVLAIGGVYLKGRLAGKKDAQAAETETALKQAKDSNEIDSKVRADSDAAVADKLRKYQRD